MEARAGGDRAPQTACRANAGRGPSRLVQAIDMLRDHGHFAGMRRLLLCQGMKSCVICFAILPQRLAEVTYQTLIARGNSRDVLI